MNESEGQAMPPCGGVFAVKAEVADADAVGRAVRRMAHEIVERNEGLDDLVLVALQTGGVPFGDALAEVLSDLNGGQAVPSGRLDIGFYRDDLAIRPTGPTAETFLEFDIADKVVVIVDDVLFTGRTIRSALNAMRDLGRARRIQLAVMVDRGHRELPIRPDFVGKNIPTSRDEIVRATLDGIYLGEMK